MDGSNVKNEGTLEMNANEWAEMTKLTSEIMKLIEKNREQKEEIESLKDKLYLTKQSLDIVDSWIGKAQNK